MRTEVSGNADSGHHLRGFIIVLCVLNLLAFGICAWRFGMAAPLSKQNPQYIMRDPLGSRPPAITSSNTWLASRLHQFMTQLLFGIALWVLPKFAGTYAASGQLETGSPRLLKVGSMIGSFIAIIWALGTIAIDLSIMSG